MALVEIIRSCLNLAAQSSCSHKSKGCVRNSSESRWTCVIPMAALLPSDQLDTAALSGSNSPEMTTNLILHVFDPATMSNGG